MFAQFVFMNLQYVIVVRIILFLYQRYLLERSRSNDMSSNMKRILSYCNSLALKHKISMQLGLQEIYSGNLVNDGFLSDVTKL